MNLDVVFERRLLEGTVRPLLQLNHQYVNNTLGIKSGDHDVDTQISTNQPKLKGDTSIVGDQGIVEKVEHRPAKRLLPTRILASRADRCPSSKVRFDRLA